MDGIEIEGPGVRIRDKLENQMAMETAAGREAMAVYWRVLANMTGEQRIAKAFELTELTRQTMRAGLQQQYPEASEKEIQRRYVDRLLGCHGLSLEKIRQLQAQESRLR